MEPANVLADAPTYRITLHRTDRDPAADPAHRKLVVTFGGQPSDLADAGFGTAFCLAQGWDTVYVAQRLGTQYQGLALEVFRGAVAPIAEGRDVVAYGSSLGAYAAFYYGGCIDARIIGGAPMFPAWPALGNRVYSHFPLSHRALGEVPRSSQAPVAIYDPTLPRDVRMIEEMIAPVYPDLRRLPYSGAGHTVLITLQQTKQLQPLILSLIAHDRALPIQPLSEGSAAYHLTLGRKLRSRDPAAAQRELERALELKPARQTLSILLALLLKEGRMSDAQAWVDRAHASRDNAMKLIPSIRDKLHAAGVRLPGD